MKLIEGGIQLTEVESILFTIGMEVEDGTVFQTKAWQERECFKNGDGTHQKHIGNLKCCADEVFIEGRGKKRTYTLVGLYSIPMTKIDGRSTNTYRHTDDELILDEYVFNYLLHSSHTHGLPCKSWAYRIGFFEMEKLKDKDIQHSMKDTLDTIHHNTMKYDKNVRTKIINLFTGAIKTRGSDIVEKAFNRLEKAGRITVEEEFYIKTIHSSYKEVSSEFYEQLTRERNLILEDEKFDKDSFRNMEIDWNRRTVKYYEVKRKVSEHLADNYGVDYFYIAKNPTVIEKGRQTPSKVDGMKSYYNRLFKLTEINQKKYKANGESNIAKQWYLLNMYSLLKVFGIEVPKDRLDAELIRIKKYYKNTFHIDEKIKKEVNDNMPLDF